MTALYNYSIQGMKKALLEGDETVIYDYTWDNDNKRYIPAPAGNGLSNTHFCKKGTSLRQLISMGFVVAEDLHDASKVHVLTLGNGQFLAQYQKTL